MALFFYKEKNKDIRAAAYLRLSIEDGDKAESNSIGNQRELIRDFVAERPELYLVGEYADAAVIIGLKTLRLKKCWKFGAFWAFSHKICE